MPYPFATSREESQMRRSKAVFMAWGTAALWAMAAVAAPAGGAAAAPNETVLYSFTGSSDGCLPWAGLIADKKGNLYGTTQYCGPSSIPAGTVFKLARPSVAGGAWKQTVLYSFGGSDGANPFGALIGDKAGNLYGTTSQGGLSNNGTAFKLGPPGNPGNKETILHSFAGGSDGGSPFGALIADEAGNLYGTTFSGGALGWGAVFELSPPVNAGGAWKETVLHSFLEGTASITDDGCQPFAGLIADKQGNLYGTTTSCGASAIGGASGAGVVFKLAPPSVAGGAWKETVLYSFRGGTSDGGTPNAGLIADPKGNLYGTTVFGGASGAGVVFKLAPPSVAGGAWKETVLYSFGGGTSDGCTPQARLIADSKGNLFGTTAYCGASDAGTVFKLAPPSVAGGAWKETVLYSFGGSDGASPVAGLIADEAGNLYGTTYSGGAVGSGTVYRLTGTGFVPGDGD